MTSADLALYIQSVPDQCGRSRYQTTWILTHAYKSQCVAGGWGREWRFKNQATRYRLKKRILFPPSMLQLYHWVKRVHAIYIACIIDTYGLFLDVRTTSDYDVIDVAIYDSIQVVLIKDTSANNNTYQLHYLSNNNPDGKLNSISTSGYINDNISEGEEEPEVEISISTCVTSSSQEGQGEKLSLLIDLVLIHSLLYQLSGG